MSWWGVRVKTGHSVPLQRPKRLNDKENLYVYESLYSEVRVTEEPLIGSMDRVLHESTENPSTSFKIVGKVSLVN